VSGKALPQGVTLVRLTAPPGAAQISARRTKERSAGAENLQAAPPPTNKVCVTKSLCN
jgi:hypothetical protein